MGRQQGDRPTLAFPWADSYSPNGASDSLSCSSSFSISDDGWQQEASANAGVALTPDLLSPVSLPFLPSSLRKVLSDLVAHLLRRNEAGSFGPDVFGPQTLPDDFSHGGFDPGRGIA